MHLFILHLICNLYHINYIIYFLYIYIILWVLAHIFIKYLASTRNNDNSFKFVLILNSHNKLIQWKIINFPFFLSFFSFFLNKWGNWGSEVLNSLPKVMWLRNNSWDLNTVSLHVIYCTYLSINSSVLVPLT